MILSDIANKYIGIKADHRALAPCLAIAEFISSMLTGDNGLRNMPLRACTEFVAATIANFPFSVSTNSTLLPVSSPRAARTPAGIVICPLDVTEAVAMIYIPWFAFLSLM
jgi:hypothetical protein